MDTHSIPIANVYYLLCYAWDQLEEGELVDISKSPSTSLIDLFTRVLCAGVRHLARRGLDQGYQSFKEELTSVRGRLDILATERRFLSRHGRAVCEGDDLTVNILSNQILRGTLARLCASSELDGRLRHDATQLHRDLKAIDSIEVTSSCFRRVQLHSNARFYRFLMNVCELVHEQTMPDERDGGVRFRDFLRDERAMSRVFERFLFNFLRRELGDATIKRDRISWRASSLSDPDLLLLPAMNTDISVYAAGLHLIIDAKYYRQPLSQYYDASKLHSGHLYQLMSYLGNATAITGVRPRGMLLYPRVDRTLRETYVIQGHQVTIATLDLSAHWALIHEELLEIAGAGLEGED